jgi:uncharacterized membrane protein YkvA (DUF1232 family)|tara:strand:+ start:82 stop:288 length:207 start_codon:yes stop_codon:yes gene_type:complete
MKLSDEFQLTQEDKDRYEKRIVFALEYFLEEYDEIPDSSPQIGLLDDYVLVRWVVDDIISDNSELFTA